MKPTIWLSPTIPISILLTIAIGSELLIGGLLRGEPYFVSQAIGQDIVTLGAALPALVVGAILASRGSERARPVWLGVLTYLVYTYIIYAFHVRFNPLFLVYVALLGCLLYALIGGLATTDFAHIKSRSSGKAPLRAVGIFLAVVVVLFYFSCLGEVVPALISGEVPQSVVDNGTPTNGVHVLDMARILPAAALTAIWLWQKRALAYALAGALLTFFSLLGLAITAMMISMSFYAQPVAPFMAVVFGVVAAVSLYLTVWYLKGLKNNS